MSDASYPIPNERGRGLYLWEPRKAFRPRGDCVGFNRGDFGVTVMYGCSVETPETQKGTSKW